MILVTGATGTTGSIVLRNLAEKGAAARAMARDPGRVPAGFEVVRGDFEDAASLRAAVKGVEAVFLLSSPGGHVATHDLALVDAALGTGVRKIVKVSAIGTGEQGYETTSGWHQPGEEAIRASGLAWTILRPSSFASNALSWAPQIQAGEPLLNHFGTGTNGVVAPRDIAAVAVDALLTDNHDGQVYTLTGPELLSMPEQVAQLAAVIGRPLKVIPGTDDQLRADLLALGADEEFVGFVLKGYEFVRQGGNAVLTGDVERALGRPPGTFKAWAEQNRAAFL
ncbi:SDR family oxidoreductase [Actinocrispum wychmicini]|uniref:Uncharacterized protein YbjT (DUF2867 family) n=1 Tax=Actinocrispum wychmicini TaxID=1213861 RepID=A0A4V2S5K5_9PSEU|nr:SDR family oxidoreductase [Actinocrispum wychmicini]TCO52500.1 uncharacterized protein YbjT (DUF2867 family) [Actinocrispum wychmicini]